MANCHLLNLPTLKITFATGFISKHQTNGYYSVYITNLHLMEKQIPHGDENNPLIKELLNKGMTSQVVVNAFHHIENLAPLYFYTELSLE